MIPLQNYEYGHIVLISTAIIIVLFIVYDVRKVYYQNTSFQNINTIVESASQAIYTRNAIATSKKEAKTVTFSGDDEFNFR